MWAIETKFLGPTNNRGSRYKASCNAGSITLSADYSLGNDGNHRAAAEALVKKLGRNEPQYGELVQGSIPSLPEGYVFMFVNRLTRKNGND